MELSKEQREELLDWLYAKIKMHYNSNLGCAVPQSRFSRFSEGAETIRNAEQEKCFQVMADYHAKEVEHYKACAKAIEEWQPVRLAKWIEPYPEVVECSACKRFRTDDLGSSPFCPWCGARMIVEEE